MPLEETISHVRVRGGNSNHTRVKIPGSPESRSFDQPIQGDSIGSNGICARNNLNYMDAS